MSEDANVYKQIGTVLVKQDLAEANANVRKRIEYISGELYASFSFIFHVSTLTSNVEATVGS